METTKVILVVEDEAPLRKALVHNLSKEGFTVVEAADGEQGLAAIRKQRPDLILTDITMPGMDGFTMLERMQAEFGGEPIPTIALTNLTSVNNVAEALSHGTRDFLIKSDWKIADVVSLVKERLIT